MSKLITIHRQPAVIHQRIDSRAELLEVLRRGGLAIPDRVRISVYDPGVIPGFDDPPDDALLHIDWSVRDG